MRELDRCYRKITELESQLAKSEQEKKTYKDLYEALKERFEQSGQPDENEIGNEDEQSTPDRRRTFVIERSPVAVSPMPLRTIPDHLMRQLKESQILRQRLEKLMPASDEVSDEDAMVATADDAPRDDQLSYEEESGSDDDHEDTIESTEGEHNVTWPFSHRCKPAHKDNKLESIRPPKGARLLAQVELTNYPAAGKYYLHKSITKSKKDTWIESKLFLDTTSSMKFKQLLTSGRFPPRNDVCWKCCSKWMTGIALKIQTDDH